MSWIAFSVQITAVLTGLLLRSSYCNFFHLSQSWLLNTPCVCVYCYCAWKHTCYASWRWELGVGMRRLIETGHTHSEYWWDAVQSPQMCKSDTHTHSSVHIHNLHLCDPCHDLLSFAFIPNVLWHEAHCVIWITTKRRMPGVVVFYTEIAE